jgi:hypothetical protein
MKLKIVNWLQPLIDHLWKNRKTYLDPEFYFDYPDYGGLPPKIHNELNSHHVDLIQERIQDWSKRKNKDLFTKI